jgi:hypothetical protein
MNLFDICREYIENCNYPSFEDKMNERIYNLCFAYLHSEITERERTILTNFFKL